MGKTLKRLLIIVIMISGIFMLTGCGNKENIQIGNNESEDIKGSRTLNIFTKEYYIKYSIEYDGQITEVESTQKGDKVASKMEDATQGVIRTVQDSETTYNIIENQKMIIRMPINEEYNANIQEYLRIEENEEYTSGTESIAGTEYYYEEFDGARFYFIGNELKLMKASGETVKVLEYDNKAREDMFEIPTDYTDMTNMIGM